MRYVAAYMLAVLGGNTNPSAADVKKILGSVGIDADETCVKKVIGELKGKNVEDVMAAGREKLSSMPSGGGGGGGGGGGSAPAASGSSSAAPAAAKEVVEEKKKEESESDEDEDMGFGLFD